MIGARTADVESPSLHPGQRVIGCPDALRMEIGVSNDRVDTVWVLIITRQRALSAT